MNRGVGCLHNGPPGWAKAHLSLSFSSCLERLQSCSVSSCCVTSSAHRQLTSSRSCSGALKDLIFIHQAMQNEHKHNLKGSPRVECRTVYLKPRIDAWKKYEFNSTDPFGKTNQKKDAIRSKAPAKRSADVPLTGSADTELSAPSTSAGKRARNGEIDRLLVRKWPTKKSRKDLVCPLIEGFPIQFSETPRETKIFAPSQNRLWVPQGTAWETLL